MILAEAGGQPLDVVGVDMLDEPVHHSAGGRDRATVRLPALQQNGVEPFPVQLRDALPMPDPAKAAPLVQPDARNVAGEDPGLEGPETGAVGPLDQCGEQPASDPAPLRRRRHIHAHFGNPAIRGARRDRVQRGPPDDGSGGLRDEAWSGEVRGVPLLPFRDARLEGSEA